MMNFMDKNPTGRGMKTIGVNVEIPMAEELEKRANAGCGCPLPA